MSLASPLARLGIVAGLALAVVVAAVALGPEPDRAAPPPTAAATSTPLFDGIRQDGLMLGSPTAPAVLTEFADLQCPFCAEYSRNVLPTLIDRYVRTGRLRLELHVLAFLGEDSVRAGTMAAAATEQDALWPFTESFYRHQGRENSGYATDDFLRAIGSATPGLDVERAMTDRSRPRVQRALGAAQRAAAALHVDHTPAFYLRRGDRPAVALEPSALTADAFAAALDEALATR